MDGQTFVFAVMLDRVDRIIPKNDGSFRRAVSSSKHAGKRNVGGWEGMCTISTWMECGWGCNKRVRLSEVFVVVCRVGVVTCQRHTYHEQLWKTGRFWDRTDIQQTCSEPRDLCRRLLRLPYMSAKYICFPRRSLNHENSGVGQNHGR